MRVRVVLTMDVEENEWASEYGLDTSEVRDDVRQYILNGVQCSYPAEQNIISDVSLG
jgi:hypothetical protein